MSGVWRMDCREAEVETAVVCTGCLLFERNFSSKFIRDLDEGE